MNKKTIYLLILLFVFILGLGLIFISIKPAIYSIKLPNFQATTPSESSPNPISFESAQVEKVIDGDTIELTDGRRSRYIGIDAPEIYFQTAPVCFAQESYIKNKGLVENKEVFLEKDVSETDKYGRLLRYVYVVDPDNQAEKIMINKILVLEGYAKAVTYPPDIKYQGIFLEAQIEARKNQRGLWDKCDFEFSSPVSVSASSIDEINVAGNSGVTN